MATDGGGRRLMTAAPGEGVAGQVDLPHRIRLRRGVGGVKVEVRPKPNSSRRVGWNSNLCGSEPGSTSTYGFPAEAGGPEGRRGDGGPQRRHLADGRLILCACGKQPPPQRSNDVAGLVEPDGLGVRGDGEPVPGPDWPAVSVTAQATVARCSSWSTTTAAGAHPRTDAGAAGSSSATSPTTSTPTTIRLTDTSYSEACGLLA